MQVHLAHVNACFPAGPAGDSLAPHISLDPLLELVDVDSRSDIFKYRFLDDARRCLLGRLLVRYAVSTRLALPWAAFSFAKTHRGQHPRLRTVGIDLMRIRNPWQGCEANEFIEGIAEQLASGENAALASLSDESAKLRHALALWTLKEAYTKATGDGLLFDLKRIGFELDFRPTLPSDSNARGDEMTIGRAALDGRGLAGWTFRLVELAEDDGTYWLAVALQDPKGDGAVKRCSGWTGRPQWAKVVRMEAIEQAARRAPS
ncbi:SPOSA6832_01185 [Sporobolomyces salmonicolor]|uniref:holo-[acyl-carrier-protein] synthase n=1 Tax=Sporidiobolus salmonicolor TaxID=5005 RepID=A0A0D6EIW2_SPOSA|nr:SPOSA6832_01185 [Sporobolomyces salmonicolor]